jgi:uncharacterized membrane protein HdeD (DUF308 family)
VAAAVGLSGGELRSVHRWLLVTGILALLAGAAAIVVPAVASVATAIFIGWVLVFAGLLMGAHAISRRSEERSAQRMVTAALTLAVGIYLLVAPLHGTVTLTFILAVWFVGIGALELLAAWTARGLPGTGWIAVHGAFSLVLGGLIAANLPSSADWAIGLLVGINLIFWGLRALVLAAAVRAVERRLAPRGGAGG